MTSEAQLVIKLIQEAPNGYVPLHKLKQRYHDKYGRHLERKKILKWVANLPGVYIDNHPIKHSIHFGANNGLTRHKKDEANHKKEDEVDDEANLVIKLIRDAPNGYVPLHQLKQRYHDKYGRHLERKKILKWVANLPGVYIDNHPIKHSIHFRANSGLTRHNKKDEANHKKEDEVDDEANLVIKLIREAPSGYVPLHQLKQRYHDEYGRHLERKKILKWVANLPGVYIDNIPIKHSIHFGANNGLTRHKKDEANHKKEDEVDDEANLVIKLIRDAPNGYVPLHQLKQRYHDKYGRHLERKKILKWVANLPGVYIDNHPIKHSIHFGANNGLTRHKKDEANHKKEDEVDDEANLVIKLIRDAPNGYVPLHQLKQRYHDKYGRHLERKKILKWVANLPGVYIDNHPIKHSIHFGANNGLTRHKKDEANHKKEDEVDDEANLVIKLIRDAPNGYVPLHQLKQRYHDKYGRHLERKKILKWVANLPGVYIDNHPIKHSIHFGANSGLTRHNKKDEANHKKEDEVDDEANLVIKLIREAPNGYVPLHQLKQRYHDEYGRHLEQKKILKWVGNLPGVYIDNNPIKHSIHFGANNGLTRHKKDEDETNHKKEDEVDDEANLVIKLIREAPNGYVLLEHLRQRYHDKYGRHLERKKLLTWIRTLPDVCIDSNPVTLSIHRADGRLNHPKSKKIEAEGNQSIKRSYAAVEEGRTYERAPLAVTVPKKKKILYGKEFPPLAVTVPKKKKNKKKKNGKKAKESSPSDNPKPAPQKQNNSKKKRSKARVKSSHNLPVRNDCYYGMANHKVDNQGRRKCIMHFGSTSNCQTKYWPSTKAKTKSHNHHAVSQGGPISRAIVSGCIANKIKKAGGRKAARKTKNLARLRKTHNPTPAAPTSHAIQRYRERGSASSPVYKPMNGGNEAIVVTYVPIQREVYSDAKKSRLSIQLEVERMSKLSKKSDLPKSKLSSRDAYLFKLSRQAAKKEECRRRSEQKQKAYSKQCSYPLDGFWDPLSIKTGAPPDIHFHGRGKRDSRGYKSARRSSNKYMTLEYFQKRKAQKRWKKKSSVTGRAQ